MQKVFKMRQNLKLRAKTMKIFVRKHRKNPHDILFGNIFLLDMTPKAELQKEKVD